MKNRIVFWFAVLGAASTLDAGIAAAQTKQQIVEARNRMVDEEVAAAGIRNPRVIESVRTTPRHEFVPAVDKKNAYWDMALPIGEGQTISPPFVVAYMTEQLDPEPTDKVLEIGTGSGYQAAILSPLVKDVYSIEIKKPLGERAARTLKRLKYENIHTKIGDGYQGWPEHAPFDKVIVTCSPENVPQPLVDQLKEGGRMIVPLGERYQQTLYLFKKENGKLVSEALLPTLFVPMTGTAEEKREVLPDPSHPAIYNGGFEETAERDKQLRPAGWHYLRQGQADRDQHAPQGEFCLTFTNLSPGRASQALQAFPIDGREVRQIEISLDVRGTEIRPGRTINDLPMFVIVFYDERRAILKTLGIGPWRGTLDWRHEREKFEVPTRAREAIVRVGLFGATGQVSFDNLELKVTERK
ncbi:MAG TPA: protein-L-isoaspartate(D-aspartate) O-methyltransferase [Pirellulales bacterium]|nr:protein-L-isoaspartate(D-aspartate) O-methyltransferase [Pirellulales bacterium]